MGRRVFLKRAALMGGAVGLAAAGIGGKVALDSQGRRALLAERERWRRTGCRQTARGQARPKRRRLT